MRDLSIDTAEQQRQSLEALAELKELIDQRIAAAMGGAISTSTFDEIVAQELGRA
jgi:hypothetical protein